MDTYFLADIGGTNARFALYDAATGEALKTHIYQVRENATLAGALKKFQNEQQGGHKIIAAAFAIAGPVLDDVVKLTNSDWVCDKAEIAAQLGLETVHLFNDFAAIALALNTLEARDARIIQTGEKLDGHPKIVLGPGTGLGVAALRVSDSGRLYPFATESGHVRYAPANEREYKLIRLIGREYGFVSAENLISGPGLVNLYKANCLLVDKVPEACQPSDVVARARQGDQLCRQVLGDFSAIFGSYTSQIALSWMPLGGIYLTGGVLQKLAGDFDQERFLERFATNPRMSDLLAHMPIYRVQIEIPAFMGLLAYLKRL